VYILDVCYRYTVTAALKAKAMFSAQLFDCCQTRQSRMDRCAFIADGNNNYTVSRYIVVTQLNAFSRYIHALLTSNGCYITGALNGSTKAHAPLLRFVVDLSNCCVYDKSTIVRSNGVWGFGLNHGAGFLSFMRLAYTAVKASSMSPQFTLWFCSI